MQLNCMWIAGVLAVLVPGRADADDHRPSGWMFRASPGWGYAWDRDVMCPVEGMAMQGSWYVGKAVRPSLVVGGALGMGVITGRPPHCNLTDEGLLSVSATVGPYAEWYPIDRGLHARFAAGLATLDQGNRTTGVGVGAIGAVGYDWTWYHAKTNTDDRFGLEFQVIVMRTLGHASVMPALTFTVGVD